MKQYLGVALGMAAGSVLGAGAITALHAQAKPPAYFVVEINKINDAAGFKTITDIPTGGADAAKELGGHYIARGGKITALDGSVPPERFIARRKSTSLQQFGILQKSQRSTKQNN